jgi:hypothetical protein
MALVMRDDTLRALAARRTSCAVCRIGEFLRKTRGFDRIDLLGSL